MTKQSVPIAPNNINVAFQSMKGTLKTWQHAMHCRNSEQLSSFFFYVRTLTHNFFAHYRQDKRNLQWYLEVIFVSLQKYKPVAYKSRKTNVFVLRKAFCAPDTWRCIADSDSRFCQLFVQIFLVLAKLPRKHLVRMVKTPNSFSKADAIPTIRGERATHRICSQLFQNSKQSEICSQGNGEFRDG